MINPTGLVPDISNADYHASDGISSSQLKLALKAPALYKASIDGQLPHKQTPAMALGTAVHTLVLEPEHAERDMVITPTFGRTKADREARAAFVEEHAGKLSISQEDMDKAQRMRDSIMSLTDAAAILGESENELSGWYTDPDTGLQCKYRPDARTDWALADVKTCQDASADGFARAIATYSYALSAAHYLYGDHCLTATTHRQFVFLCVESNPPHLAAMYVLDDNSIDYGFWQRKKALTTIKRCLDIDRWDTYNDGIAMPISLPRWELNKFTHEE